MDKFESFYKEHCLDGYGYNPDLNWIFEKHNDGSYIQIEVENAKKVYQHQQAKVEELQKRVDEITNIATELAEYASYAEIVGGVTANRSAVRNFCDKVFDFNRKVDQELEQALKGGEA